MRVESGMQVMSEDTGSQLQGKKKGPNSLSSLLALLDRLFLPLLPRLLWTRWGPGCLTGQGPVCVQLAQWLGNPVSSHKPQTPATLKNFRGSEGKRPPPSESGICAGPRAASACTQHVPGSLRVRWRDSSPQGRPFLTCPCPHPSDTLDFFVAP